MLIYALFMGIPALVTETSAYTLFLVEFDAKLIPYIYIGFTIITTVSGFIYTALEKRISFAKFVTINLTFLTLTLLIFRLLIELPGVKWPIMGLAIWSESSWALANLGFWSLVAYVFNVRQGKRLFALVGVGLTLSESLMGFFIPSLVGWVGTSNLLFVAVFGFVGALIVQTYILRSSAHHSIQNEQAEEKEDNEESNESFGNLIKDHYIVLIFAFSALYGLAFYALDNAFYDRLETQFVDADQLASFIGVFFAISGLLTLVLGAFVSGQLISRYGLRFGLLAMPVALLVIVLVVSVMGTLFDALLVIFWLVICTKLLNEVLAYTINRAAWQVLYEPLSTSRRLRAQTVVESMVKPIAGGLAGVILLLLNTFLDFEAIQIAYLLLIIYVIWIGVVILLNRAYPAMLLQALTKRRLGGDTASHFVADKSSVAALKLGLVSPHIGVVLYSLHMLEEIEPESFPVFLQDLLQHPAPEIRLEALNRIERFNMTAVIPAIRYRIKYETSPLVRGISLRTLVVLGDPKTHAEIYTHLDDPEPQVKLGVMVGLLRNENGTEENVHNHSIIGKKLDALANSQDPKERELAARVLAEAYPQKYYKLLLKLLQDDNLKVRKIALTAAGKFNRPQVWSAVIENLAFPKIRSTAVKALVTGGNAVMPQLNTAFVKAGQERETLIRLAQVCGRIRGPGAIDLLKNKLDFPNEQVYAHILVALSQCGYRANEEERVAILQKIKTEVAVATWTLAAIADIGNDEVTSLLKAALNKNLAHYQSQIFLLLSFIYDSKTILRTRDILKIGQGSLNKVSNQQKAYALEIIDVLISAELKEMVIPLLDNLRLEQRLKFLRYYFPQQKLGLQKRLQEIISHPNERLNTWTKACTLYTVAQLSAVELSETVSLSLSNPESLIRETAIWTLFKIDPNSQTLKDVKQLQTMPEGDKMLSLVERVILLKAVSFFSETPEDALTEVAYIIDEVQIKAGQTIIKKGEPGGALYIIVNGQVQVHDETQELITLGEREIFGELSILDPAPRSASVTAITTTTLLQLNQETFYELIDDYSIVARKIMQTLTQQLRLAHSKRVQINTRVVQFKEN